MRTLTITFVLALLVVAGCSPKSTPAPAQPKTEAATNLPKLWDFWATWCPPCKQLKPTIEALEKEYEGKIEIRSIDVDQNKDLAEKFKVQAIPTLVFLDAKGNELSRIVGLVPRDTIVGRFKTHGFIQ
jgi:thioredoxin